MTFAEYFVLLRRHWRLWGICVLLGLLGAAVYNQVAQVRYTAVATSFVTVAESSSATSGDVFQGSQFAVERVKSYAPLGTTPQVLQPVIDRLGLQTSVADLRDTIKVSSPAETVLLEVSATNASPELAVKIADGVSEELATRIHDLETPRLRGASLVNVTMTQPAELPLTPSSPRKLLDLLIGALAGAAIGLVLALIRHHFRRRIETAEDVRAVTGAAPLGLTMAVRGKKANPLVALERRSAAAEEYRTIRTTLDLRPGGWQGHQIVISSPGRGDGKTTVAANLAISWAQSGASVCLVDADLRDPAAGKLLEVTTDSGLADVLTGKENLEDVLQQSQIENLSVLPAGPPAMDPPGLLESSRMRALAAVLQNRFDVVIYDTPAMLAVADAVVISEIVGGLIVVARSGSTTRDDLATCLEGVADSGQNLLGVVTAGVRRRGKINKDYWSGPDRARRPAGPSRRVVGSAAPSAPAISHPMLEGPASAVGLRPTGTAGPAILARTAIPDRPL
ncbi:MAG TPA: polysaccharide biosynthesis tyrosine autokinase, partial [Microlunatus sp.]